MYDVMKVVNWLRIRNKADLKTNENAEVLTQMKVMKLLYFIQGTSLVYLHERFFPQDVVAWKYGPAVEKVHNKYRGQREIVNTINEEDVKDYKELNESPKHGEILSSVYDTFGNKSAYDLMRITHKQSPWINTDQGKAISDTEMINFFQTIVEK